MGLPVTMLQSVNARTGQPIGEAWSESTPAEIDAAVKAATAASDAFAAEPVSRRATLLRALATALESKVDALVSLADAETGLGVPRLQNEVARTCFQLRGFADVLERANAQAFLDEPAVAGPPPAGRPHLTRVTVPVGPVAMFGASNFPFAFSVLGGDTASALAAGCPVVVKAHPAHPELSRRVAALAHNVVTANGFDQGVFQFVQGGSIAVGVHLTQASGIAAVAFTGSFKGGTALAKVAAERPRPIPFYGELGSVNPLVVLPAALQEQGAALAQTLAGSICLGAGQFCTSPGVVVVPKGDEGDAFVRALTESLQALAPHAMLTAGIRNAFEQGVARWRGHVHVSVLLDAGLDAASAGSPKPFLAEVDAAAFVADAHLHEEVFGSAALVVRVSSIAQANDVLKAVGGSLTVTLWGVPDQTPPDLQTVALVRTATQVAGRVLFAGVPTGVAVTAAQHHGGPFPASTMPASTSVGYAAIERFQRPVALQDAPAWLTGRKGLPC